MAGGEGDDTVEWDRGAVRDDKDRLHILSVD